MIYIGNDGLLVNPIDAYQFSHANYIKVRDAYMKEVGVSTPKEFYEYCEEHDIPIPDPSKVSFPTIAHQNVRVIGRREKEFQFIFMLQGPGVREVET